MTVDYNEACSDCRWQRERDCFLNEIAFSLALCSSSLESIMRHRFSTLLATATAAAVLFGTGASFSATTDEDNIQVNVDRHGEVVYVHAEMEVAVPRHQAFEVMTDYEHMKDFLPNLKESKVLERSENQLIVAQSGVASFGPFSVPFDYVRQVDLQMDTQIRSHVLSGSVKKADVTTRLTDAGEQTHITYESETIPGTWIPFGVGTAAIAGQVRRQMKSMLAEMHRRESARQPVK